MSDPVPIYPLLLSPKPVASFLAVPPKSAFLVQVFSEGSYSQKSFLLGEEPSESPVPIYPLPSTAKPTADLRMLPPKSAFYANVFVTFSYS